jgi:hypothetical protein
VHTLTHTKEHTQTGHTEAASAQLYARNPLREAYRQGERQAPGVAPVSMYGGGGGGDDGIMRPR